MFVKLIQPYDFANTPIKGVRELLHELYNLSEGNDYVKTTMEDAYAIWKRAFEVMATVYGIPLGNALETKKLVKLDDMRDLNYRAFLLAVRASLESIDLEVVAAAEVMQQAITSFPVDINSGYLSETAQLDSLLDYVLGPELENTTKAGVLQLAQNLKAINDQIHEIVAGRDVLRVERDELPTRPEAREQAISGWRFFSSYVNSYLTLNFQQEPAPELTLFVNLTNKCFDRYHSIYLGPTSNKPSQDGEETDGEQGEGEQENGGQGGEQGTPKYKVTFINQLGEVQAVQEYEVGQQIVPPEPPAGYIWNYHPNYMPAEDLTVDCLLDE